MIKIIFLGILPYLLISCSQVSKPKQSSRSVAQANDNLCSLKGSIIVLTEDFEFFNEDSEVSTLHQPVCSAEENYKGCTMLMSYLVPSRTTAVLKAGAELTVIADGKRYVDLKTTNGNKLQINCSNYPNGRKQLCNLKRLKTSDIFTFKTVVENCSSEASNTEQNDVQIEPEMNVLEIK